MDDWYICIYTAEKSSYYIAMLFSQTVQDMLISFNVYSEQIKGFSKTEHKVLQSGSVNQDQKQAASTAGWRYMCQLTLITNRPCKRSFLCLLIRRRCVPEKRDRPPALSPDSPALPCDLLTWADPFRESLEIESEDWEKALRQCLMGRNWHSEAQDSFSLCDESLTVS